MAIGISYLEEVEVGPPRNSITVFDRKGNHLYTYSKIHTCAWTDVEAVTAPGGKIHHAILNTIKGNVTIGSMICYDREHIEPARMAMQQGSNVL